MRRAAAEKAREFIRDMANRTANDSAITISSFGDDETAYIESEDSILRDTNEVFEASDESLNKEEITKSASESKVAAIFTFEKLDESFKQELNRCGKRFERASGAKPGKNRISDTKPVSISLRNIQ